MPCYLYQHPKTQEVKEVIQTMKEVHEYFEGGVEWKRIFTVPQGATNINIDPFNSKQFVEKTGGDKEKMGDTWDRSKEMSEKRAAKAGGVDPVREKYFAEYAKKHKGNSHPEAIQEKTYTI